VKETTYWLTPPEIYEPLNRAFNFDFDPAPHPRPAWDGLAVPWGKSNFVNPPYGDGGAGVKPWVRKALEERELGKRSTLLLPVDRTMYDLLRAGPTIYPLDAFQWVSPDGKRREPARPVVAFVVHPLSTNNDGKSDGVKP